MSIQVTCPQGHKLKVPEKLAGKTVKCPRCAKAFQIPTRDTAEAEISLEPGDDGNNTGGFSSRTLALLGVGWLASVLFAGFLGAMLASRSNPTAAPRALAVNPSATSTDPTDASPVNKQPGTPATDTVPPGPAVESLQADIREAISLLERRQYRLLIHDFMPEQLVVALERRSARQRPGSLIEDFFSGMDVADLQAHLEAALTGEMAFNRAATLVEVNYVRRPVKLVPPSPPASVPKIADRPTGRVPGLGADLPEMLATAAALLEAEKTEEFVRHVFPLAELARLSEGDLMQRHLLRISSNPAMSEAMIRDLKAAAIADISVKGQQAEVTLPPLAEGDQERLLKFEQVDGHWRFFDGGRRTRPESRRLVAKPIPSYTIPGSRGVMMFTRTGDNWRIKSMPEVQPIGE